MKEILDFVFQYKIHFAIYGFAMIEGGDIRWYANVKKEHVQQLAKA